MGFEVSDYKKFDEIEQIRENSKKNTYNIKLFDYGAGTPNNSRTLEESYLGIQRETTIKDICSVGLKGKWAELIYSLVKESKPLNILELGTCCGFSSIYMAKASPLSIIHTIEGDSTLASIAEKHIKKANCSNIKQYIGKFQDILDEVLEEIALIDFAFIDGHHDKDATIKYFHQIKPFLTENAIVVFDDISWSEGMKEAWEIIKKDSSIERVEDLQKLGICYINKG
ncbi:O-methyltransferase [Halarcobacter bivalviorum]|uniref:O-methyltransferase n=1 Tax=Halarcobacter bivalviorum TaxID=663364 RepID=UPI00100BB504|nr:class I SAM-dependent methyltransferase [Halarcobacter bivalviorum]RXK05047.1 methyltransferase [Halarcobacter bivalviorum]